MDADADWWSSSPLFERPGGASHRDNTQFPPTLIIHGELDSIVPVQHSEHWLKALNTYTSPVLSSADKLHASCISTRTEDVLVTIPGAKHSYEIATSALVDVTIQGAIGWLTMCNSSSGGSINGNAVVDR